jgi:hypothetical protein
MMGRNQANGVWTSAEHGAEWNQLTKTNFDLQWKGGAEIRVGRRFCCCCTPWAAEFVYWSLDPFQGMVTTNVPGGTVTTPLRFGEVEFAGVNGYAFFDNSAEQRLWRADEFHNLEINLLRSRNFCGGCLPWNTDWIMGFRYMRFRDHLIYGAVMNNNWWGDGGGAFEAYVDSHTKNNLFAFQLGFETRGPSCHKLQWYFSPKVGVGFNHIDNYFALYRGDGVVGEPTAASGMTGQFPVSSSKDVFSFITQIDVGLEWNFSCRWAARIGYRVMVATGVGLADDQIPFYIVDVPEIKQIDYNSDLILHGCYAGISYNF